MMQQLKLCAFVLVLLISGNGFSFIHVCGNHTGTDGVTSVQCFSFSGKCDDEKNLAGLSELFPGGWTCAMPGIASQETGSVHLIAAKDGGATVVVGGVRTPVGSDDFLEFVNRLVRENQGMRVNTQVLQGQFDAFLDTDNGVVSNARLKELSRELGVPIEREGSSRPRVQPGTGRGASVAVPGSNSVDTTAVRNDGSTTSGARRPDQCSLPDCSCRVVSPSRELLCEGGTEEETAAGVHYCKCGKFGAPSLQSGGAGGDFTVDNTGAVGWSEPEEGVMAPVADPPRQDPSGVPSSRGQSSRSTRGPAASESVDNVPPAVWRTEGREAAVLLCRDVETYRRSRQVATSPGTPPPFSSVEPLCALADNPQRIQNYRCSGGKGDSNGRCAESWWESVWDGLSYCEDLKILCETAGAKWSTQ